MAEYDAAAPRRNAARRTDSAAAAQPAAPTAAPLGPPAGFRLATSAEVLAGAALVGQAVLYRWPVEGWVRGTVAGRSRAAGFSHVHVRPRDGGGALAARRSLARPGRPMGAPSSRRVLVGLPFSGTTVMGLLADGPGAGCQLQTGIDKSTVRDQGSDKAQGSEKTRKDFQQ